MLPLLLSPLFAPSYAFADDDWDDDDKYEDWDDDDRDDDDDEDEDEDDRDDDRRGRGGDDDDDESDDDGEREVEADVFTDTTIVKVELENGRKTVFSTGADTREEVIAEVMERFDLTREEVLRDFDFEIEDRASRPKDRAGLGGGNVVPVNPVRPCRDDDDALEVEADVFTDITVVKVALVDARDEVFTTSTTTRDGVIAAVRDRFDTLTTSQIEAALDFDVEDRASRPADRVVDNDCVRGGSNGTTTPVVNNTERIRELQARIVELQTLLERLINLIRGS